MTQLLGHPQVPQVSAVSNVPIELIEQETLNILGINIIDKQDKIEDCIPHGTIRWWVERGGIATGYGYCWRIQKSIEGADRRAGRSADESRLPLA
jgi:hypothetical protein